jgi:hypothetical protein
MKIREVDSTIRSKQLEHDRRQITALEERLLSCQRDLEENSKVQMEQRVCLKLNVDGSLQKV